jgi:hypothetical protein
MAFFDSEWKGLETTWLGDFGSRAVSSEDTGRVLAELRRE